MAGLSEHLRTVDATRMARSLTLAGLVIVLFLIFAWPAAVRATTLERLSVEQMARRATLVVQGDVVSTTVKQTPAGVRTAVRVRVQESLKGAPSAFTTFYVPGGVLPDGSRVVVDAMPSFQPGESCYVFVDTRGWVVGGFQGKLDVAAGHVLGSGETTAAMNRRIRAALGRRETAGATSYIEGTVWDSAAGYGHMLAGVLVTCERDGFPDFVRTTTTDAGGYYRFDGLPVEDPHTGQNEWYLLTYKKEGYERGSAAVWISAFGSWQGMDLYPSTIPPEPKPIIASITPGEASAGTDTHVTIRGANFGATKGKVEFSYGRKNVMRIAAADVSSWTAASISCAVPTALIDNYSASAGSGPVVVTTAAGQESNTYYFEVTFGYGGSKWANPSVTYYVNASGVDDALRESLIDAGAAVWNAANSAFRFVDGGTTAVGFADDGTNVISWADGLPQGVLALAASYVSASGVVTQSDIQFSNAYVWGSGSAGSSTQDIQSTGMHEIGHWLRLLDQYMDGDSAKVMYAYAAAGVQKRTLAAGDTAGIRWIYPLQPADTVGPVCSAQNATVKKGKTVKLYLKVHDALSAKVTMKLAITTKSGSVKKTWTRGYGENFSGWWYVNYKCTLKKGAYRLVVTGKDLAGNAASKVGRATLTVK